MREIIFRGKSDSGVWVYGSLIKVGNYCCILKEDDGSDYNYPYLDKLTGCIDGYATPVDPETVGQWTGFTDTNGIKIFEGDVACELINGHETEYTYRVRFCNDRGGWYPFANGDGCGCCENETFPPASSGVVTLCVIIGNIHDNPDLS
jgi:hypothetical protein